MILGLLVVTILSGIAAIAIAGNSNNAYTLDGASAKAVDYVRNDPTYTFDGIRDTLAVTQKCAADTANTYNITVEFDSAHSGYGDRTDAMVLMVITHHTANITVEKGLVKSAIMDGQWDMMAQAMINGN